MTAGPHRLLENHGRSGLNVLVVDGITDMFTVSSNTFTSAEEGHHRGGRLILVFHQLSLHARLSGLAVKCLEEATNENLTTLGVKNSNGYTGVTSVPTPGF